MEHKTIYKNILFTPLNPINSGSKALVHNQKQAYDLINEKYRLKYKSDFQKLFKSNFIGIN